MACQCVPYTLCRDRPFWLQIQVRELPWTYRTITALPDTAPVRLTVPGHGLTQPWPVAVVRAAGVRGLNSQAADPAHPMRLDPWRMAEVVDADTLEINNLYLIGPTDYVPNSGELIYAPPADLGTQTITATLTDAAGSVLSLAAMPTASVGVIEVTAPLSAVAALAPGAGRMVVSCGGERVLCFDPVTVA